MPTRLSMALCVGILACVGVAGYAVRTPILSGKHVAATLESFARRNHVNLRVQTYHPLGLSGLRFEGVHLRARRGDYLLEANLYEVDVRVSLPALFSRAQIYPGEVEVHGGEIRLIRQPGQAAPEVAPPKPTSPAPSASATSSASSKPAARAPRPPLLTILHDVSVSVDLAPLPAMQRPLWVQRADFLIAPASPTPIVFRHAYGQMPDGMPFAVKVLADSENASETYLIKPRAPTRIDRWFNIALPVSVSTESMTVCPQCSPAIVELKEVEFAAGEAFRARSEQMSLSAGQNEVRLNLATVSAEVGQGTGQDAAALPYQLANFELQYDALARTSIVQGELKDTQAGVATFSANWSAPWGVLTSHVFLTDFHSATFWKTLGLGDTIPQGVHSGDVEISYEPALDLLEFSLQVDSKDLILALPLVNDEPLEFAQLGLKLDALFQPKARTLSLSRGEATLQGVGPVRLDGYAVDAGAGFIFDISLRADKLHPQQLRDALPETLSKLARGSNFEGEFGFEIHTAGHTRFPDEITLSVGFQGDVTVLGDSRSADVLALAGGGPPSIDLPGTLVSTVELKDWIDYGALPERVPLILAAAEDAKFFKHEGFDWVGVRQALAFNIEEGALKRGGSTLSQQLSKNLFLDRDRTLARKLQEAYVTWRLEDELSKQRIMELYVNMVEWGPNIQGIRAAARRYFDTPAEELGIAQTALLGAILPGPSIFGRQVLAGYLPSSRLEKIEHILANLRFMKIITPLEYSEIYARATSGWIGDLKLVICADDSNAPDGAAKCR